MATSDFTDLAAKVGRAADRLFPQRVRSLLFEFDRRVRQYTPDERPTDKRPQVSLELAMLQESLKTPQSDEEILRYVESISDYRECLALLTSMLALEALLKEPRRSPDRATKCAESITNEDSLRNIVLCAMTTPLG